MRARRAGPRFPLCRRVAPELPLPTRSRVPERFRGGCPFGAVTLAVGRWVADSPALAVVSASQPTACQQPCSSWSPVISTAAAVQASGAT
jgi:hypothetical protein